MFLFKKIQKVPLSSVFLTFLAIACGVLFGFLASLPIEKIPYDWSWILSIIFYLIAIIAMLFLFLSRKKLILEWLSHLWFIKSEKSEVVSPNNVDDIKSDSLINNLDWSQVILLDTSAIIDGRIADIVRTGFIQGVLVVLDFVLEELQQLSDSKQLVKRNRARRGFEVLEELKKAEFLPLEILNLEGTDSSPVDISLIDLAQKRSCRIMTTDFNLSKLGKVKGVQVLNVHELANMVKTVLVPGEVLSVKIVQSGKEGHQGVGYLPDGTMVVVENAQELKGQEVEVLVDRFFQTDVGKMIFAKMVPLEEVD